MIRRIVMGVLVAFIALATLLTVLLGTEPGTRWLISQGSALAPGQLRIEQVEGTLLRGVGLDGIDFRDETVTLALQRLELRVNGAALLAGRLAITRLNVHGLDLHTRSGPDETPSEPFRIPESVVLPLAIDLAPARFTDLSLRFDDAEPLIIRDIRLSGSVDRRTAHVRTLSVDAPSFGLDLTGQAELAMPYALHVTGTWRASLPETVAEGLAAREATGRASVEGDLSRLGIEHQVESPVRLTGTGELRDLHHTPAWDLQHRWESFAWQLPGKHGPVRIHAGQLQTGGHPDDYRLDLDTAVGTPDLPVQHIRLTGHGDTRQLSGLRLEIQGDAGQMTLEGSAGWLPLPAWDLAVSARDLDTSLASPELPGRLSLDARLTGGLDESGALKTDVDALDLTGLLLDQNLGLQGSARISDNRVTTPGLILTVDGGVLELEGSAGWEPRPHWDLRARGRDLDPAPWLPEWPGQLALALESSGRLEADNAVHGVLRLSRLQGRLAEHAISARGEASLQGHGLSTPGLRLEVDGARLNVMGDAHWAPVPRWNLRVEADNLDPALIDPRLPGRLTLRGRSEGDLDPEQGINAHFELDRLGGTLRDQPVSARGSARLENGRHFSTPGLEARLGANRVEIRGRAALDTADLHYRIDAPDLNAFWPGLRGRLDGAGQLSGDWRQPQLNLRLNGAGLGFEDWSMDEFSLQARGTWQTDRPLALDLALAGIRRGQDVLADSVSLTGRGHANAHRLDVGAQTPEGDLTLRLEGRLNTPSGWAGTISVLNLADTRLGDWALAAPAPLETDGQRARLAPLCLAQGDSRLCLEAVQDPDSGLNAGLDLGDLPLEGLAHVLPENLALDGDLFATARLQKQGESLILQSRARINTGELQILGQDGERHAVPFRDVTLEAGLEDGILQARTSLSFLEGGQADAELRATPEGDTHRLSGRARADLQELRWLEIAVPQLRDPQGRLRADLILTGTLETPDFRGELTLSDARALLPEAGLELTEIHLQAGASGLDRLTLDGRVRSGPGTLSLDGEMGLRPDGTPWARMTLSGERFQAIRRPEAEVLISPDLAMELAAREIRLTGELAVPEARIALRELPPQAVSVSRDEVIVDAETPPHPPWQVYTRVTVTLGNRVSLSGFGLSARLAGQVDVEDSPARPTRVVGEIRIEDGRYRAYGQNLLVERGVLVFQGPADNPGLDIRAVRRIPAYEVTAGMAIGGTLQDPRSRIFSTPAMEDSEAMSYLLTGRPLSGASEADANVLAAAITAFGVEQGGMLTQQIGQSVGLDEFTVGSEGDTDQSALLMGKHLSSRLYVRYTVGLFERASSLMLRYSLSRSLSLETQSSDEAQSMDLIYRLER